MVDRAKEVNTKTYILNETSCLGEIKTSSI